MIVTTTLKAGQIYPYTEDGDFFRFLEGAAPITVHYYRNGAEVAAAEYVRPGYAEQFKAGGFNSFTITSEQAQIIQFVSRNGNAVVYDTAPTGKVSLSGNQGVLFQGRKTVTWESAQLLPANPNRQYLLLQNKDDAATVFVHLGGDECTIENGIQISPGAFLELTNFLPSTPITAMCDLEKNDFLVVVEG